ncbi:MAG: nicotinate-nucleotide diphosphorylase, partial [Methylococcales bacterium]|nr:nicotinate-nucleotide diphosphorylase [Methylococcales bacterium]
MTDPIFLKSLDKTVQTALEEDIGSGDLTAHLIQSDTISQVQITLREDAIVCGRPWFDEVFRQVDPKIAITWHIKEGSLQAADTIICELTGNARQLLTAERSALNFLQLLSGTATTTHAYASALTGTNCKILDTRKT